LKRLASTADNGQWNLDYPVNPDNKNINLVYICSKVFVVNQNIQNPTIFLRSFNYAIQSMFFNFIYLYYHYFILIF